MFSGNLWTAIRSRTRIVDTKTVALAMVVVATALGMFDARGESLYDEASFRPLIGDQKAHRVGDLLTVQVFENSSASTNADTVSRRKSTSEAQLTQTRNRSVGVGLEMGGEFDGGGRTQRANRLLATLSVSIQEVLPSGELRVAGEQLLTVNQEEQKVRVEGRVRQQDISDGNTVLSTRLADAKITYVGDGEVTDRQRRSWLRKAIDWLGF
jgi:flagellar L-ring protein FlgH